MEWFSQKTSIAGLQISNWMIVLGAVIVALLIYTFMQDPPGRTETDGGRGWERASATDQERGTGVSRAASACRGHRIDCDWARCI